jgi:hypothetical protein
MKNEKLIDACFEISGDLVLAALWTGTMAMPVFKAALRFSTPNCPNIHLVITWVVGLIMFGGLAAAAVRPSWIAYKKGDGCKEYMPALGDCAFTYMATTAVGCISMLAFLVSAVIDWIASGGAPNVTTWQGHVASIVTFVGSPVLLIWLLMISMCPSHKEFR